MRLKMELYQEGTVLKLKVLLAIESHFRAVFKHKRSQLLNKLKSVNDKVEEQTRKRILELGMLMKANTFSKMNPSKF